MLHYIRSSILPSRPIQLLIRTGLKWNEDNCPGMAASLSYFALFSLFPMLLVILSVFGLWAEPGSEAFRTIQEVAQRFLPPEVHGLVKDTVVALYQNSVGAGIIGFGLLFWSSTAVFSILRSSVNRIWRSPNHPSETGSVPKIVLFFVANRLFAFLLVLGVALLLATSLVASIAIKIILGLVTTFQETFAFLDINENLLTWGLQASSSIIILALAACILYKILPSIYVSWNDVWLGAIITAVALVGLQQLVSNSVISIGSRFLSYGVIGSVMVLLLWIFLTFQIFLFGCVFTHTYAHIFGSRRNRIQ